MSKVRGRRDKNCCESKSNAYNNYGQETTLCYPDARRGDNATHHISMGIYIKIYRNKMKKEIFN
jgi:hypothetical protein